MTIIRAKRRWRSFTKISTRTPPTTLSWSRGRNGSNSTNAQRPCWAQQPFISLSLPLFGCFSSFQCTVPCKSSWEMLAYLDTIVDESDPDTDLSQVECDCTMSQVVCCSLKCGLRCSAGTRSADCRGCASRISRRGVRLDARRGADPRFGQSDERKGWHVELAGRAPVGSRGMWWLMGTAPLHIVQHVMCGVIWMCLKGDIFPVGCKFSEKNVYFEYFANNPDWKVCCILQITPSLLSECMLHCFHFEMDRTLAITVSMECILQTAGWRMCIWAGATTNICTISPRNSHLCPRRDCICCDITRSIRGTPEGITCISAMRRTSMSLSNGPRSSINLIYTPNRMNRPCWKSAPRITSKRLKSTFPIRYTGDGWDGWQDVCTLYNFAEWWRLVTLLQIIPERDCRDNIKTIFHCHLLND